MAWKETGVRAEEQQAAPAKSNTLNIRSQAATGLKKKSIVLLLHPSKKEPWRCSWMPFLSTG